jgi:O-antigen ligase
MALMLNLILPVCIALFLASRKAARKWLLAGIFGLLVLAILATFSRAGFLTLGVSCLCYLWLLRNRRERFLGPLLLVLLVIALPLVPADYVDRLKTIVSIEDDASGSAQTRLGDIGVALGVVLEHPVIGSGIGMNALALNEARGTTWTQVHNVYLQIAVELGLPGLTMFLLLYARCLGAVNAVLRNTRTDPQSALYCLAEGIKVSLLAFGVAAMFHPVACHFYFYYIAGLALATHNVWLARGGRA